MPLEDLVEQYSVEEAAHISVAGKPCLSLSFGLMAAVMPRLT